MLNNSFMQNPTLLAMRENPKHANEYSKSLDDKHQELCFRFLDFKKLQNLFTGGID